MDGYGKCPDCGLDIPLNVEVCPYCSRNLDVKPGFIRNAFSFHVQQEQLYLKFVGSKDY